MSKRYLAPLLFPLIGWLHAGAQVQASSLDDTEMAPPIMTDTVPNWVRKINLQPHEWVLFKKGTSVDYLIYGPLLTFHSAVARNVLTQKGDSVLKASRKVARDICDTLRLKKGTTPLTVTTFYFDRACANAGLSRRIVYSIKGRKCSLLSDSTFDDSYRLDTALYRRLQQFHFMPNQFFVYQAADKAIILDNITPECKKDSYYRHSHDDTPAAKVISRVLFQVVQRNFPQFNAVGCGCTAPFGEYHVDATILNLDQENLRKKYDELHTEYEVERSL